MSNLKLPKMSFDNLSKLTKPGESKKIAYETWAYQYNDGSISVIHHSSVIANISEGGSKLYITNAGWGSPTTRNRIDQILRDSSIPFWVTQKNFVQYLRSLDGTLMADFHDATFWDGRLDSFNGKAL